MLGSPPSALALDPAGNIIVAGITSSFQLPVTNGSTNPSTDFAVSTDHGQTWHPLSNLPSGWATAFGIGPASWPAVYAVSAGNIFKSLDGGTGWTPVSPVPGASSVTIDPTRAQVVYVGSSAGIHKTTDGGATWSNIAAAIAKPGAPPLYIAIDPFHPNSIYTHIVFTDYRTFDGGKTWSTYILPGVGNDGTSAGAPAFDPLQPGVVYATGGIGIFRSADGGQTWVRLNTPFQYGGPVTVSAAAPGVLWVRDESGNVYRSNDQGLTFTLLQAAPRNEFQFVVDPFNPSIVLTGGHRTADGGATWQTLSQGRGGTSQFDASVPGRAIAMSSNPGYAGFVAKLDATGQKILFAAYLGGFNGATVNAVTTDSAGNFYVTGRAGSDFPMTANAVQPTPPAPNSAGSFAFAAKFDPTGNPIYATYLTVLNSPLPRAIAVDAQGNVEIAGQTFVSQYEAADCFLTKLSADGSHALVNANFARMNCDSAAFDAAGNGVAVGYSADAGFPVTPDALQPTLKGSSNAVVVKFDSAGKVVYATYLGGSGSDAATAVAFDAEGDIYVTGTTKSKDFPTTEGAYQTSFSANCPYATDSIATGIVGGIPITVNQNSFVTKLDRSGVLVYSTYLGGNCKDSIYAIAVDSGGDAWVTGSTDSSTFPQVWPVDGWTPGSSYQGFVTRFAGSGTWVWRSSYVSGSLTQALATDAAGNAYLGVNGGVLKVSPQP
jgi:photosystem II stability/assembly factor-like uncharacterized protein